MGLRIATGAMTGQKRAQSCRIWRCRRERKACPEAKEALQVVRTCGVRGLRTINTCAAREEGLVLARLASPVGKQGQPEEADGKASQEWQLV